MSNKIFKVIIKEKDIEYVLDCKCDSSIQRIDNPNLFKITRYFTDIEKVNQYLKSVFNTDLHQKYDSSNYLDWKIVNEIKTVEEIHKEIDDIANNKTQNVFCWIGLYSIDIIELSINDSIKDNIKAWSGDDNEFSIVEIFGADVGLQLTKMFNEYISKIEEDCIDSQRIGIVDDVESMNLYETFKTCCGSNDTVVELNGVKYMFGCNFGH